ncbi:retrotransposon protein, putative, ty1-copia subclass, partial [Tanacetum coccineum]
MGSSSIHKLTDRSSSKLEAKSDIEARENSGKCLGSLNVGDKEKESTSSCSISTCKVSMLAPKILAAILLGLKDQKDSTGLMLMPWSQRDKEIWKPSMLMTCYWCVDSVSSQHAEQELIQNSEIFHSCKLKGGQSVSSLHEQLFNMAQKTTLLLCMLFERVKSRKVKSTKYRNPKAARGQNQGNGKNKHAYAPKPKIPPLPKREDPAKDLICHECGETGHWKRNCPQYLAELLKKNKNAASGAGGSGIFTIKLNTFLNRSWIYDTGCGTHICNTTQGLRESRKLKPGALSLYVGNGQREAVEAIGNFDLSVPSGLVIVLNNCHYDPSITRGVISVSCLYEDGFINRFVNNTIQVSRNNMVYFSAIPRDGIFEIDFSNSYANESSIYILPHLEVTSLIRFVESIVCSIRCVLISLAQHAWVFTSGLTHPEVFGFTHPDLLVWSQTTLRKSFWDYALKTAARILNMVPTKKVEKTPYEIWHGQAPKLSYLKVWGCEAHVKRDTLT